MAKYSEQARLLYPYLLPMFQRALNGNGSGSGGSGGLAGSGVPNPHGLNSTYHTGTLTNIQFPQGLLIDGSRALSGHLSVNAGITIDGVDLSAFKGLYDIHVADPDAHHDTATAGNGLSITGQQLSVNQAFNFTWTGNHTFSTGVVTHNTDPQINANLDFIGGAARLITAGGQLTIQPTGELWFNPASNLIVSPNDIEWRSQTIGDTPTGISGWRISDDGGNQSKLTITRIKADELFVRFFTADETRIFRGEGLWGKSFGIVETNFVVPADEATVDVWFEAIAELPGFDIFEVGDWLISRDISVTTGLVVQKIWWTVAAAKLADNTTADGIERQQWRIKRESGGATGATVHKGSDFLDAGVPTAGSVLGGGIVHLSALAVDGGPFIQTGYFDSVLSDVPQFLYTTRMGNLNGTVDYTDDVFGFVAGNNIDLTPGGGFSGLTADADLGMRLFNTDLALYDATVKVVSLSRAGGLQLVNDSNLQDNEYTSISWFDDLTAATGPNTIMTAYANGSGGSTFAIVTDGDVHQGTIALIANGLSGQSVLSVSSAAVTITSSAEIALDPGGTAGIIAAGTFYPIASNTYDLGTASLLWRALYVGALHATTISGTTISGAEWEHTASMVIDANSASNTIVSVANQGAGRADLDVDRNITLGGTIDGVDISVHAATANAHHDAVTAGNTGISLATQAVSLFLNATASGLEISSGLRLADSVAGAGLAISAAKVLSVNVSSGIVLSGDNLALDPLAAGAGLGHAAGVLSVNVGAGMAIVSDAVAVSLGTNPGLSTASGLVLGTPSTLTNSTTNAVTSATHTHAITATHDAGATASLLKSGPGGGLLLGTTLLVVDVSSALISMDTNQFVLDATANTITSAAAWTFSGNITQNTGVFTVNTDLQLNGDLDFVGPQSITTTAGDLTIDPFGAVIFPNAQEIKTGTFTDAPTGIVGFRMFDVGSNYRQFTTGAIKVDELYARAFVADEVRLDRGEEFWSRSYGVVETDFALPADEATVDVWFEDAPSLGALPLFDTDNWILIRTIDWDTSMSIVKVWFQIVDGDAAGTNDWISHDATNYRQQWRLRRRSGGSTGLVIKKGVTALDVGAIGQGQIYLSALKQDGGPFIEAGSFTSVASDAPVFSYYTRMGNLKNTLDYGASDAWGFIAGNDIGNSVATFSGAAIDSVNGMRLFNTALEWLTAGNDYSMKVASGQLVMKQGVTSLMSFDVGQVIVNSDLVMDAGQGLYLASPGIAFMNAGGATLTANATDVVVSSGNFEIADGFLKVSFATKTISGGAITATSTYTIVDTEAGAATDDLDNINGGVDGRIIIIRTLTGARDVVIRDGVGNISCPSNRTLNSVDDMWMGMYNSARWVEISYADNAAA